MDYEVLETIQEKSDENKAKYEEKYGKTFQGGIEKLDEPWGNSDENLQVYFYHNFFRETGPIDLIIVINEIDEGKVVGDFAVKKVETAVYPLYSTRSEEAIDIPAAIPAPDFHPDIIKFILEKRGLKKKKYNEEFDPTKHKWDINRIASTLNISNRLVARYCRAKNI